MYRLFVGDVNDITDNLKTVTVGAQSDGSGSWETIASQSFRFNTNDTEWKTKLQAEVQKWVDGLKSKILAKKTAKSVVETDVIIGVTV